MGSPISLFWVDEFSGILLLNGCLAWSTTRKVNGTGAGYCSTTKKIRVAEWMRKGDWSKWGTVEEDVVLWCPACHRRKEPNIKIWQQDSGRIHAPFRPAGVRTVPGWAAHLKKVRIPENGARGDAKPKRGKGEGCSESMHKHKHTKLMQITKTLKNDTHFRESQVQHFWALR